MRSRGRDGWHEVRALLTIGADGRFSRLRRLAGFKPIKSSQLMDVLWFRLQRKPDDPRGLMGRFGRGHILGQIERGEQWQVVYIIAKGSYRQVRAAGLEALRHSIVETAPEFADRVAALIDWQQIPVLSVEADRLPRWYRPGLLLIGDAAHVMSPAWGNGIHSALMDAVATANLLTAPLQAGQVSVADLARVQRRHELPTRVIQATVNLLQDRLLKAALDSKGSFTFHSFLGWPLVRELPPLILGFGVRPEHVQQQARRRPTWFPVGAWIIATVMVLALAWVIRRQELLGIASQEVSIEKAPLRQTDVTIVGIRSTLIEGGNAEASEAVVFVHGNLGSSRDWQDLAAQVSAFARAVALDMSGYGRAQKPEDFNYTVDGYAQHLASALTELGICRVHLVLHDFGGLWGLVWAVANRDAFASAVLLNTGAWLDYHWRPYARLWRTPVLGEVSRVLANRASFHLLLKHDSPRGLPAAYINQMYDDYCDRGTHRAVLKLYRATDNPAQLSQALADALRPLDRPALVVCGKHDRYLPVRLAHRQREVFPNAQVIVLEQSGHWPFADDPAGVAAVVVPFLRHMLGG